MVNTRIITALIAAFSEQARYVNVGQLQCCCTVFANSWGTGGTFQDASELSQALCNEASVTGCALIQILPPCFLSL